METNNFPNVQGGFLDQPYTDQQANYYGYGYHEQYSPYGPFTTMPLVVAGPNIGPFAPVQHAVAYSEFNGSDQYVHIPRQSIRCIHINSLVTMRPDYVCHPGPYLVSTSSGMEPEINNGENAGAKSPAELETVSETTILESAAAEVFPHKMSATATEFHPSQTSSSVTSSTTPKTEQAAKQLIPSTDNELVADNTTEENAPQNSPADTEDFGPQDIEEKVLEKTPADTTSSETEEIEQKAVLKIPTNTANSETEKGEEKNPQKPHTNTLNHKESKKEMEAKKSKLPTKASPIEEINHSTKTKPSSRYRMSQSNIKQDVPTSNTPNPTHSAAPSQEDGGQTDVKSKGNNKGKGKGKGGKGKGKGKSVDLVMAVKEDAPVESGPAQSEPIKPLSYNQAVNMSAAPKPVPAMVPKEKNSFNSQAPIQTAHVESAWAVVENKKNKKASQTTVSQTMPVQAPPPQQSPPKQAKFASRFSIPPSQPRTPKVPRKQVPGWLPVDNKREPARVPKATGFKPPTPPKAKTPALPAHSSPTPSEVKDNNVVENKKENKPTRPPSVPTQAPSSTRFAAPSAPSVPLLSPSQPLPSVKDRKKLFLNLSWSTHSRPDFRRAGKKNSSLGKSESGAQNKKPAQKPAQENTSKSTHKNTPRNSHGDTSRYAPYSASQKALQKAPAPVEKPLPEPKACPPAEVVNASATASATAYKLSRVHKSLPMFKLQPPTVTFLPSKNGGQPEPVKKAMEQKPRVVASATPETVPAKQQE